MLDLKYLITITKREFAEQYIEFFKKHGANNVLSKLCNGTASQTILDYLSLVRFLREREFVTIKITILLFYLYIYD